MKNEIIPQTRWIILGSALTLTIIPIWLFSAPTETHSTKPKAVTESSSDVSADLLELIEDADGSVPNESPANTYGEYVNTDSIQIGQPKGDEVTVAAAEDAGEDKKKIEATFGIHSLSTAALYKNDESFWNRIPYLKSAYPLASLSQLIELSTRTKASPNDRSSIYLEARVRWEPTNIMVPAPQIFIDQMYTKVDWTDHLLTKAGILRPGWGTGFFFTPTETFSPPIDPLNPSRYKPGVPTIQIQTIFERFSGMAVASIKYSSRQYQWFGEVPTWEDLRFGLQSAFILGKKQSTDWYVNASWNQRGPLTFGSTFRSDWKVFVLYSETALSYETKSRRYYPDSWNVVQKQNLYDEIPTNPSRIPPGLIQRSNRWIVQTVVGLNRAITQYGLFILEYYYNQNGYTMDETKRYQTLLERHYSQPAPTLDSLLLNEFSMGNMGEHYAATNLSYGFHEGDITVAILAMMNLEDGSQYYYPSVTYSGLQNCTFSVEGTIATDLSSYFHQKITEFGSFPFHGGLMLRMESFF